MSINNVSSLGNNSQQLTSTFYTGTATQAQINAAWNWLFSQAQNAQEKQEVAQELARYQSDPSGQPTAQVSITGNLLLNSALQGIDPFQDSSSTPAPNFQQALEDIGQNAKQNAAEKVKEMRARETTEQAKLLGNAQFDTVP